MMPQLTRDYESLKENARDLQARLENLEDILNALVKQLGVNPHGASSPTATRRGGRSNRRSPKRVRSRSRSPQRARRQRTRSRSRSPQTQATARSPRSRSPPPPARSPRSRSGSPRSEVGEPEQPPAVAAPQQSTYYQQHKMLPGIHVKFQPGTARWTVEEAREICSAYGTVHFVKVPKLAEDRWLDITFDELDARNACLADTLLPEHHPGVSVFARKTASELEGERRRRASNVGRSYRR